MEDDPHHLGNHHDIDDDDQPMVVTPAPSSPDSVVGMAPLATSVGGATSGTSGPPIPSSFLTDLWKGRTCTQWRDTPDPQPTDTPWWYEEDNHPSPRGQSSSPLYRFTAMIQDLGDVEYLQVDNDDNNTTFVERQAVVVVTDYLQNSNHPSEAAAEEKQPAWRPSKRPRTIPTTFCLYIYSGSNSSNNHSGGTSSFDTNDSLRQRGLQLHQLVEWVAVPDTPDGRSSMDDSYDGNLDKDKDHHMGDMFVGGGLPVSMLLTGEYDDQETWAMTTDLASFPRWHVVSATPRTLDALYMELPLSSANTHNSILPNPADAILLVQEALHVSVPVATALWLTLLARAEPVRHNPNHSLIASSHHPPLLVGCTALRMVVPPSTAAKWIHHLTQLVAPAVPLWQCVDLASTSLPPRLVQRHGRVARQAWQYPAGTTLLVHEASSPEDTKTTATANNSCNGPLANDLLHSFQLPLHCEGGQVCWVPADWRIWVVQSSSSSSSSYDNMSSPCVDLSTWTPGYTAPCPDRHAAWGQTLATLRTTVPSVALDAALAAQIPHYFGRLRQRPPASGRPAVTQASLTRWLTWTRLWARAHGRATAVRSDWEQALQLDASLGWC